RGGPRRCELDRDGARDAVSGDRPAPRAEGGRGPGQHDAARRAGGRPRGGDARARDLRRGGDQGAAPAPLRGEQPLPPAARRRGPRRLRYVPRRAPRRDRRAPRAPVVPREPVSPGVQVAPDATRAALPRVRRRRARALARPHRRGRACDLVFAGSIRSGPMAPDVLELFTDLVAIKSPPGEEREVADRVTLYLRELGLEVDEDAAGAEVGSTAGNLYCRVEGTGEDGVPLFLCAHLDTVPPDGEIEPVVEAGTVRNSAGPSLRADNKSAGAAQ